MKEFKYVITDKEGIHGKEADCKRMFAVMGLGVKNGQEVVFTFDGEDEDAACEAVSKFMKENL